MHVSFDAVRDGSGGKLGASLTAADVVVKIAVRRMVWGKTREAAKQAVDRAQMGEAGLASVCVERPRSNRIDGALDKTGDY